MDANKIEALKKLIEKNGIVFRKVTLSSGKKSEYYYDLRKMCLDPKAIHLISDLLLEEIIMKYGKVCRRLSERCNPISNRYRSKELKQ